MNAQHKLCRIGNRLRRIARRITELNAEKAEEVRRADKMKRDPDLGNILAHIHRLQDRSRELGATA